MGLFGLSVFALNIDPSLYEYENSYKLSDDNSKRVRLVDRRIRLVDQRWTPWFGRPID
ncbi:uncharacterized protein T551_02638 [Pneumocystis jirovecii RU7]|uniref:Uncharacterized protein n=1 Tax=Pneumocystis jirovecii (strain RU7) TaxID=1408657 RepID=A0A0W4ZIL6_PNEJ7|nr:uncharacterized protein T551_02638 [Pneumocystis jirovecii RU7]KTW28219.1 hypothetical protein T551_02638 [Pneumocystis jirovecii RU7]